MSALLPRRPVPELRVALAGGGVFDLASEQPERFTLVVFYRGLHCPICRKYLADLEQHLDDFASRGIGVVAASSDTQERAQQTKATWNIPKLRLGYNLDLDVARHWGLYISSGRGTTSIGIEEPALFSEPGLFLIRPDDTLYFAGVQSMPFARPHFSDVVAAVDWIIAHDYPARGEVAVQPAQTNTEST